MNYLVSLADGKGGASQDTTDTVSIVNSGVSGEPNVAIDTPVSTPRVLNVEGLLSINGIVTG